jgi:hypothetical protein
MENNKKQTAVEYLANRLPLGVKWSMHDYIQQAKEMEKEQITDAFGVGCQVESKRLIGYHEMAEQYFNETYEKK